MTTLEEDKQEFMLQLLLKIAYSTLDKKWVDALCDEWGFWKDYENEGKNRLGSRFK
jgi:hypothetical protein